MTALDVFWIALGTALATGLGVVPVMIAGQGKGAAAISSALAAGAMLGASVALFYEGFQRGLGSTLLGAAIGVAFIVATGRWLGHGDEPHVGNLRGSRGLAALLVIGAMTVHSFTEGVAVGVALADESSLGFLIAIAIAVHNIPEGVAISLTLVPHGESPLKAALWSIFSSLPQPLMAVPAFLAVRTFERVLPLGLGFAGGAMVWIVFTQLIPSAFVDESRGRAIVAMSLAAGAMIALEVSVGL